MPVETTCPTASVLPAPCTFKCCKRWEEFASVALGAWLGAASRGGHHCYRERLPEVDFPSLFATLAETLHHPPAQFAFCAVGFGYDERRIGEMTAAANLQFAELGQHLQRAVLWRNRSDATILAIARGEPEGRSSLQEFENASSFELARIILKWMANPSNGFTRGVSPLHERLLDSLVNEPPRQINLSFEGVARFAAAWTAARDSTDAQTSADAPLFALAELDVAWDRDLLYADGNSPARLRANLIRARRDTDNMLAIEERQLVALQRKADVIPASDRPAFDALLHAINAAQCRPTPKRLRAVDLGLLRRLH